MHVVYFCWFAAVGLFVTYGPYFLRLNGFDDAAIGLLFSARVVVAVVAQLVVTQRAERAWGRAATLRSTALLTAALACALALGEGVLLVAVAAIALAAAEGPFLPLLDTAVMQRGGEGGFARVRLWGSVGYGLVVGGFALWAGTVAHAHAGVVAVVVAAAAWTLCAALSWRLERAPAPASVRGDWQAPRWGLALVAFLVLNALHWAPLMSFNVLFALHTESLGLSAAVPGLAVATMIAAEVVGMRLVAPVLGRASIAAVFVAIGLLGALRWGVTGLASEPWLLIGVQVLNLASFGLWLPVALCALGRFGDAQARATLTGRFYAVVFGLGGVLGASGGAWLLEHAGGDVMFGVGAACELVAGVGLWAVMSRVSSTDRGADRGSKKSASPDRPAP